ncbi:MAG: hypothetical protein Kow00105_09620 [Phycisphaeraceae bacterium]
MPAQRAGNQAQTEHSTTPKEKPFVRRPFVTEIDGQWIGNAICYGPHRNGQAPGAESPTPEQLLEDLKILSGHWRMLRTYSSVGPTETLLKVIRDNNIDMKVVVGAWIGTEATVDDQGRIVEHHPEAVENNRNEVKTAIRLANEYPDIVTAITVGNETQVFWSFHKVRPAVLIEYIRQARAGTTVPVSTADVYTFWNSERSQPFADEVDFIMTHIYAMWNQQSLDNALAWTQQQYHAGLAQHPDHLFVIGEAGWATQKHNEGEQARLITGKAGEAEQARFYHEFIDWTTRERIPNFFFEAFDENWKGGEHPDEVEKHWGLYNEDRTPKQAMQAPAH